MSVIGHGVEIVPSALQLPVSPVEGMLVYQSDTNQLLLWDGASWVSPMANQPAGGTLSGTYPNPNLGTVTTINSGASSLNLQTNGNNRISIDSNGRILYPNQPRFYVYRTTSVSTPNVIVFNNVWVNNGSHYNTSNGRFTAPVTGHYFFSLHHIGEGNTGTTRVYPRINGARQGGLHLRSPNSINYADASMSWIWSLTAGQYVDCEVGENTAYSDGDRYLNWLGFLLG